MGGPALADVAIWSPVTTRRSDTAHVSDTSGRQMVMKVRVVLLVLCVLSIALYAAYAVWAFSTAGGAMRWFLLLLPPVVGGGLGWKWHRDHQRWLRE